jgi:hypothetical protein
VMTMLREAGVVPFHWIVDGIRTTTSRRVGRAWTTSPTRLPAPTERTSGRRCPSTSTSSARKTPWRACSSR